MKVKDHESVIRLERGTDVLKNPSMRAPIFVWGSNK